MKRSVYLRPLVIEDALVSWAWRNNAEIWAYTGSRPNKQITPEIETAWLQNVLQRKDHVRFAICLVENDKYIGNVFFTDYENNRAQMHVFIGEPAYWGQGRAQQAMELLAEYGFEVLQLESIFAQVNFEHPKSFNLALRTGFKPDGSYYNEELDMMLHKLIYTREMYFGKISKTL